LFGEVGIDMIAGPTDLTIIADESAAAKCVAMDLFSQLEHGGDSRVFLLTDSQYFANLVNEQIAKFLPTLSRMEIVDKSIKNSAIVLVKQIEQAADAANKIAPEHLQICTKSNDLILKYIKNAGAVFVGNYTSESFGDYILGPSHVLPTGGSARFSSGLSVMDFLKKISIMQIANKDSARLLASDAIVVAKEEGLEAHAMSMQIREDIR
jgi:histidinol dehydrogenase